MPRYALGALALSVRCATQLVELARHSWRVGSEVPMDSHRQLHQAFNAVIDRVDVHRCDGWTSALYYEKGEWQLDVFRDGKVLARAFSRKPIPYCWREIGEKMANKMQRLT